MHPPMGTDTKHECVYTEWQVKLHIHTTVCRSVMIWQRLIASFECLCILCCLKVLQMNCERATNCEMYVEV